MKPRHLLNIRDLNGSQIRDLLSEAARLKNGTVRSNALAGKTLGLLFQKPSVRTRVSFEVGMHQLGGNSLYIGPVELEGGKRESPSDLARVLSRYLDGIVARTFSHRDIEDLARWSNIPVINGLSDESHPCQALSDLLTLEERFGALKGLRLAYVGDGNNVCHSLMEACALMGLRLKIATPSAYRPDAEVLRWSKLQASKSGGEISGIKDPRQAVRDASAVYTDVWTSMGQEKEREKRRRDFKDYQINSRLMKLAHPRAVLLHCLPAHRGEEVSDELMDSDRSIVYDQAENRLHVQKAILLMLLGQRGPQKGRP